MQSPHEDNPFYRYLRKDNTFMHADAQLTSIGKGFVFLFSCWASAPVAWRALATETESFTSNAVQILLIQPILALIPFLMVMVVHYLIRSWLNAAMRYFAPLVIAWLLTWGLVFMQKGYDGLLESLAREHQSATTALAVYLPLALFAAGATWLEHRFAPPPKKVSDVDILDDNYQDL